jgi:hypothetical protein
VLGSRSGIRCLFNPWIRDPDPGWEKSGSGMNILDHPRAWKKFLGLKILKFFDTDPDPEFF